MRSHSDFVRRGPRQRDRRTNSTDLTSPLRAGTTLLALLILSLLPAVATPALAQDEDPGTLRFQQRTTRVTEEDGLAVLRLDRIRGDDGEVSVSFETEDGSAVAGEDYEETSGTLIWGDGQRGSRTIQIPILDDADGEGQESFRVVLTEVTGDAELADTSATVRIRPSDRGNGGPPSVGAGILKFDQGNFLVIESSGEAVITVDRFRGAEGDVSVLVETRDHTAEAGEDYEETSEILEWADGEQGRKTLLIPILDDDEHEPTEHVRLRLVEPEGGAVLDNGRARALLTIRDDDRPDDGDADDDAGEIEFTDDDFQVIEDADVAVIEARRSGGSLGAVSVEFSTSDGSAVDGEDYVGVSGVLSWEDGESGVESFEVEVLEDELTEGNETVELSLANPTGGAELGSGGGSGDADGTLTILDNDGEVGVCVEDDTTLCLSEDRFQVEVVWRTSGGDTGEGQAVDFGDDTGFFWFFDEDNLELMVKVLDACSLAGFDSYWVFFGGTTDVDFTVTVTDTASGVVKEYMNPGGDPADPVQDTLTFQTCP